MLLCWLWKCPFGQFTKLEYFKVQKLRLARISDDIFKSFVKSIGSLFEEGVHFWAPRCILVYPCLYCIVYTVYNIHYVIHEM